MASDCSRVGISSSNNRSSRRGACPWQQLGFRSGHCYYITSSSIHLILWSGIRWGSPGWILYSPSNKILILIESSILDTIFLYRTSSLSAIPVNTINITGLSGNTQHDSSPDHDLYRHRWLRMVFLLLYGLSLAVAADLLYMFPYARSVITTVSDGTYQKALGFPEFTTDTTTLAIHYAFWFSLNIILLGAFTFLVISIPDGDSRLRIHSIGHQVLLLFTRPVGRRPPASATPRPEKAWIVTLSLYITVAGIIAGSLVYDWRWIQNYSSAYLGNPI